MPILIPLLLLGGGVAALVVLALSDADGPVPDNPPDLPAAPAGKTRWKLVNAILPQLQQAAQSSGIPMGLLVGWVAKESGGKIGDKTSLGELGLFQLMPSEYQKLGLDPNLLSTDVVYSINGGLALIGTYSGVVDRLAVAQKGTSYYWRLVKLVHSMGSGAVSKIIDAAKSANVTGSWGALESWAVANDAELLHATKHSPKKWFNFVDDVYQVGAPFGFGADSTAVAGAPASTSTAVPGTVFSDIPDPLDCLTS